MPSENGPAARECRIYTVGELNRAIQSALKVSFPAAVRVRGEVQRLSHNRSGHIYFELHGQENGATLQIKVAALKWDRSRFGLDRYFDGTDPDLQLREKLEVCIEGVVDFYPNFGSLSLKMVGVDKSFTLGQLEARRREVLAWLKREGMLELNAAAPLADVPLRVGLVTSAGSAAEHDFLSGLRASPWRFVVERADCRMMGDAMVAQVVRALGTLPASGVDVVVVTRGGGSKADLSWFDNQDVAAAVARCPVPVITAIGHEIDRSIADVVAQVSCKTPTAAAQHLVDRVEAASIRVETVAERVAEALARRTDESRRQLSEVAARMQPAVAGQVNRRRLSLQQREDRVLALAERTLRDSRTSAHEHLRRLGAATARKFAVAATRLDTLAAQTRLLDPQLLLARGWTLTVAADGSIVKSVAGLAKGQRLATRFHDGRVESVIEEVEPASE